MLEIGDEEYAMYEITSKTSVKAREGKSASIQDDIGMLRVVATENTMTVLRPFSLAPITCQRIERLPAVCTDSRDLTDPVSIFEIVWNTFNENYAFFELRNVDWAAEYDHWRPKVSSNTTDEELFTIVASMVSKLDDYHVDVRGDGFDYSGYQQPLDTALVRHWRKQFAVQRPGGNFFAFVLSNFYEHVSATTEAITNQLVGDLKSGANGQLGWGVLPNQVGYLTVRQMAGFSEQADAAIQFKELTRTLDLALAELAETRGMIVDVRFNGGGWDDASMLLAGRFADSKRVAFSKKARAGNEFTSTHVVHVEPGGPRQYTRPVVLLTSPVTASAAEIFTYCMTALPHVTHAGLSTRGSHSDMLERHLPNGWTFHLSNEVYQDPNGEVLEKVGIRPPHKIPMFTRQDLDEGQDQILVRALRLMEAQLSR